jgi:hypothetical protein
MEEKYIKEIKAIYDKNAKVFKENTHSMKKELTNIYKTFEKYLK